MADQTPSEDRIRQLEKRIEEQQHQIERYKTREQAAGKASRWSLKVVRYMLLGPTLAHAVERLIMEAPKFTKATVSKAMGAAIRRLAIISFLGFLFVMIPPLLLMVQNKKIERQNELFIQQNKRIEIQSRLAEANRRSSLNYMLGQILSQVNMELNSRDTLSDPLIARIIGLSHSLRPYKFYEHTDSLSDYLSPERGQLLISLINISSLDTADLDKIYAKATFQNADLRNTDLRRAYLARAFLQDADLSGANLSNANLRNATLIEANLEGTVFSNTNMQESTMIRASLRECMLIGTNLNGANLTQADLYAANLRKTQLEGADLLGTDLQKARFYRTGIDSIDLVNKGAILQGTIFEERNLNEGKSLAPLEQDTSATGG